MVDQSDFFMNRETLLIAERLNEAYTGQPWFNRGIKEILLEIKGDKIFERPDGQHSILDLLWHIITWKEFTISRLRDDAGKDVHYFEKNNWRELDHGDKELWENAVERYHELHTELVELIRQQKDELLIQKVRDRDYDFRKLLYGIGEHDIYHIGQIAYLSKLLNR
jgi:uncharacterized damage-inducible protein DinB